MSCYSTLKRDCYRILSVKHLEFIFRVTHETETEFGYVLVFSKSYFHLTVYYCFKHGEIDIRCCIYYKILEVEYTWPPTDDKSLDARF